MKRLHKYLLAILSLLIALYFFTVRSDREYVSFPAQEGEVSAIKLSSGSTYTQTFTTTGYSISKLALFLRPATTNPIKTQSLDLTVKREQEIVATQQINPSFINSELPTQIRFSPPIPTAPGQSITLMLSVPSALSGQYRAQLYIPDEQSRPFNAIFLIDDEPQDQSLAFNAAYDFRPPLAYQLGTLLTLISFLLVTRLPLASPVVVVLYVIAMSFAFTIPLILIGHFSLILLLAFSLSLSGMYLFLRHMRLPLPAVLIGSHVFAFTTYFPLHITAGRDRLLLFAFMPWLFFLWQQFSGDTKRRLQVLAFLALIILFFAVFLPYNPPAISPIHAAHVKDIFLDPNQVPITDKFHASYYSLQIPEGDPSVIDYYGGWDNFGSYVGIINLILAIIGLIFAGKRHWRLALLGIVFLLISSTRGLTPQLAAISIFPPPYLIIITTFSIAVFAALGLSILWRFLGRDRIISFIMISIVLIALLDLLNVSAKTLQFGLL